MLSGFNTNFRHRGVLFHVQTEDSGTDNPHVITHLFHGGNIMASVKLKYTDRLDELDLEDVVRGLMEGQHKEMLKQLSRGEHDDVIAQRLGPNVFSDSEDDSDTVPPDLVEPSVVASSQAGAEPTAQQAIPDASARARPEEEREARPFGADIVSQKPLDEVVLDYLVENARKRKRPSK